MIFTDRNGIRVTETDEEILISDVSDDVDSTNNILALAFGVLIVFLIITGSV